MTSETVGEIETDGGVLVIRRIHVTYRLSTTNDTDTAVLERVLDVHAQACPVYRSLHPQIAITTSLELEPSR